MRSTVDTSGTPLPVYGLPDGVLSYRCRFRVNQVPVIFLRFSDRIQKHILLRSGDGVEPFESAQAVNVVSNGRKS